ncbi:type IV secretion system protein [Nocardioides sp. W3-2-3]|uniref:type IV secretion system protein n=1 Tax=Nocardioides convexus TaxID=2712224 RepID=UPI002418686D|nr:type IV secretion system protein [Nocardioides convexus]NHA01220.1 type IV secretion system protein [Nocardioides convexus]
MKSLLKVQTWPDWDPLGGLGVDDITDAGVATALAFLGIFLWLAAIGHLLVYLARAASLLVLTATGPLSAAGLVSDFTRSWFWKSLRWLHAAAFTPVLMITVLGIGVQFANGVAAHLAEDTAKTFGTALPAVMTILIGVVAPMALFKPSGLRRPRHPQRRIVPSGHGDPGRPPGPARRRRGWRLFGGVDH